MAASSSDLTSFSAWERWRNQSFSKLTIVLPLVNLGLNCVDLILERNLGVGVGTYDSD